VVFSDFDAVGSSDKIVSWTTSYAFKISLRRSGFEIQLYESPHAINHCVAVFRVFNLLPQGGNRLPDGKLFFMTAFSGAGIFWTTLAVSAATLFLFTVVGRVWALVLPFKFQGSARFYLSPVIGLASLTVLASLLGRIFPLGNSIIVPLIVIALLAGVLSLERHIGRAFIHAITVSGFGIVCGVSLLGPLFVFGAFNAHNDAFTYLVHGNWLQDHAFGDVISKADVTPLTSQVSLYQHGFRMGASYLLAIMQALLNLRWSNEVYPGVVISVVGACCLTIGFPLARPLSSMHRGVRLALLALPAFTLGGLVFGANLGFFPQAVGLALGAGLLFSVGPLYRWVATTSRPLVAIAKAAIPGAVLFSGGVFAYPEFAPFLLMAVIGSGLVMAWRFRVWEKLLIFSGTLFGLSVILLNFELLRAYKALKVQSGAVVGSSVDWFLYGFLAHAFGIHGGAWDVFQWSTPEQAGSISYVGGLFLLCLVMAVVLAGGRSIWRISIGGILMPAVSVLFLFAAGIVYFRYFVPSPFPKGMGQSWSQFKLADWAHPFVMVFVLLAVVGLKPKMGKFFAAAVVAVSMIGVINAAHIGVVRTRPLMHYYTGVRDLNRFYLDFRKTIQSDCPPTLPVYLNLGGRHHKFRQMASLYLPDRYVTSDWMDDGYIYPNLPGEIRTQALQSGDCVVEPIGQNGWLNGGAAIGPFRVGVFNGQGQIGIVSATGAHDQESDGKNWWRWVAHKVVFKLQPQAVPKDSTRTKVYFVYGTRGDQTLTLRFSARDGLIRDIQLTAKGDVSAIFEKVIDIPPTKLAELSIETDGKATPLGDQDSRDAAWLIRNLTITPISP